MGAYIVVDLGFGDSGKGLLTDFLVRHFNAGVVVRYNGGAQAGHNVVTPDGRHHTFSQFGSGTFVPHVRTYLSRHVVIHPQALLVEGDSLEQKGVHNPYARLRVSDQALVITPFHQAANRLREMVRGGNRHGSCGVGVGEAVEDALLHPENRVLAGDLNNPAELRQKLRIIREQKREQISALCNDHSSAYIVAREWEVFEREDIIDIWISLMARIRELGLVVSDVVLAGWLRETENVIFEGSQGVLLDEDVGFHPFTTWSRCTTVNAFELIQEMMPGSSVFRIGVIRSYSVRHGPGPLPTETNALASVVFEHNKYNEWQGTVRYGWFDSVLARYALSVTRRLDSLLITHLDMLPSMKAWTYCPGYRKYQRICDSPVNLTVSGDILTGFRLQHFLSLEERAQLTQALTTVEPMLKSCQADEKSVIREIESLTDQSIGMISRGPAATNVEILTPLPS